MEKHISDKGLKIVYRQVLEDIRVEKIEDERQENYTSLELFESEDAYRTAYLLLIDNNPVLAFFTGHKSELEPVITEDSERFKMDLYGSRKALRFIDREVKKYIKQQNQKVNKI